MRYELAHGNGTSSSGRPDGLTVTLCTSHQGQFFRDIRASRYLSAVAEAPRALYDHRYPCDAPSYPYQTIVGTTSIPRSPGNSPTFKLKDVHDEARNKNTAVHLLS